VWFGRVRAGAILAQKNSGRHCPISPFMITESQKITALSTLSQAYMTIAIRLRYDYDATDTTTHSTTTEVIEITIYVRFHCDTTTTRLRRKTEMFTFCSRRIRRFCWQSCATQIDVVHTSYLLTNGSILPWSNLLTILLLVIVISWSLYVAAVCCLGHAKNSDWLIAWFMTVTCVSG